MLRRVRPWPGLIGLPAVTLILLLAPCAAAHAHQRFQNDVLTITGAPPGSVNTGQSYAFTPTATDSLGRRLYFAIANKPSWASFSRSSGALTGRPPAASVGRYPNIVIAVSDGLKTATLASFSVQVSGPVAATSAPPVISGTPATAVTAGSAYAFTPSASDPAGRTLSFSVQNKPAWAAFSIATGALNGTPASSQVGTYANVVISTSDGQSSAALPAFTITVAAAAVAPPVTGSASLGLTAPTANTDGTPLTDLAGFRIYSGSSPSNLAQVAQISDPAATSYTVSNLASGTWYFAATAYTTTGAQSALSAVVNKTIQ